MTVIGVVFAVLTVLFALSALANIANGTDDRTGGGAANTVGYYIGMLLGVAIPGVVAYLCLTSHKRKAKRMGMR